MSPEGVALVGSFSGAAAAGAVALALAWLQRSWDRNAEMSRRVAEQSADRRRAEAGAIGELAAAVVEMRWEAAHLVGVDDAVKYEEARKLAPLEGRMVAAGVRIYTVSDDAHLIGLARAVVLVGIELASVGQRIPFDPAAYEPLRSSLERTFRALRQHARALADLPELEGDPTNESSDDYEGEGDPVVL